MRACLIGAGIIGCAAALELQRRGFNVTVVDKNGDAGHGSTAASCGIIRRYYAQPGMIAIAHESAQIWADWDAFVGPIDDETISFPRPGMLFIPPKVDPEVMTTVAEMQRLGIKVHILSPDEVNQRFPFLEISTFYPPTPVDDPEFFENGGDRIEGAVFEEDAGYVISPSLATQNLRRAGEREGVRFLFRHRVSKIHNRGKGFQLLFANGSDLEADVVVNVSGPHSAITNRLAGVELELETRALRREVHALKNPLSNGDSGIVLPIVGDLDGGIYFRPEAGGRDIIVGSTDPECDEPEYVADPDAVNHEVTRLYRERQCLRLMKRFPKVTLGPPRGVADLYDVTVRDWYPIVDRTAMPGYYVCIGTSGSSFKTAPVLGTLMAQIIEACEGGHDTDQSPIQLALPRIGATVDTRFLSRHRQALQSSGTVIG